jgi:hypothetical protein
MAGGLGANGPALVEAVVDPFELLMPGKMNPEQAEHYADLPRGEAGCRTN